MDPEIYTAVVVTAWGFICYVIGIIMGREMCKKENKESE